MPEPQADLAYDVGLHDGADTAYYLRRGLRVVAIEANPAMVEAAGERFAAEIAAGRLTVVSVGVAAEHGRATFWISDDHTDWSSFDEAVAGRNGARHHAVEVELAPFGALLEQYGLPRFCKIDIEGNDHLCLDALTADRHPDFVSMELGEGRQLERLAAVGYDRFKLVDQSTFTSLTSRYERVRAALPGPLAGYADAARGRLRGVRDDAGWTFPYGSSGPLPDRTRGAWLTLEEALELARGIEGSFASGRRGLSQWFDIHATSSAR